MSNQKSWLKPVTLKGNKVTLEPLLHSHKLALLAAVQDGVLNKLWYTSVPDQNTIDDYIEKALNTQNEAKSLPFVVRLNSSQKIVGCTRFCNVDNSNQRLEIGYTWYASSVQKTGVNTEAKFLLLQHAFENLQAIAVEFRTHWLNHNSRNAILRLGAKQDGVLRNHKRLEDGSYRDTVVYSIINLEWSAISNHLLACLSKHSENQYSI